MDKKTIILNYTATALLTFWILAPVYWIFNTSFQTEKAIHVFPPNFFPKAPTTFAYYFLFNTKKAFEQWIASGEVVQTTFYPAVAEQYVPSIFNSVIIATAVLAVNLVLGLMAAYAVTRMRYSFRNTSFYSCFAARLIPPVAIVVPYYVIMRSIGLLDTTVAIALVHLTFTLPISMWMLNTFLTQLPTDMEDAALLDGYSRAEVVWKFILPVIRPAVVAVAIYSFMLSYGELFYALVISQTAQSRTIPVVVAAMASNPYLPVTVMSAAAVITMIPPLIIIVIFRRYLIKGLVAGALR